MLYLFHGADTVKIQEKARELLAILQKKKPDAELFKLDSDNWNLARFDELVHSRGLFEQKSIIFASRLLENKDAKEETSSRLSEIAKSENVFIFLESKIDKALLLEVNEVAEKVFVFEKKDAQKAEFFNVFSLADAFGARDRKSLWVLYQKALRENVSAEEISGILFWQIKSIMLAQKTNSASEAGISPFVFQKAKRYSRNFSADEIKTSASKLISLYHDSHRGLVDFETGLERFALSL
jgi:DNA polymerase III delta subunit